MSGLSHSEFAAVRGGTRRAPRRLPRIIVLILVVEVLAACSTVKVVYSNADRILFRHIDEYLDLTATQKQFLRPELEAHLQRHRREGLPGVIAWLETVDVYGRDGLNRDEATEILDKLVTIYADTTRRTIAVVAPVLAHLSPSQIEHLENKLTQANRRYQDRYLAYSPDLRRSRRAQQAIRRIERWTGDLTSEQKRLVTDLSNAMPEAYQDWFTYRLRQQQTVLEMLRTPATADELSGFLHQWWVEQGNMGPQLSQKASRSWKVIEDMVVQIDGSLTQAQRNRVLRRIQGIRRQLRSLEH